MFLILHLLNEILSITFNMENPEVLLDNCQTDCDEMGQDQNRSKDIIEHKEENTDEYIVEMVSDKLLERTGIAKYNVKWQGYAKSENTWEPIENLVSCDWALQNFQLHRANWLANKYANKPSIELLRLQREQLRASGQYQRNLPTPEPDMIPSNAPTGKRRSTNKAIKDILGTSVIFPRSAMNGVSTKTQREWRVVEILGLTEVEKERYFLLSLEDYEHRAFIRASLANRLFPSKVIDFYMKHFRWKGKPEAPNTN